MPLAVALLCHPIGMFVSLLAAIVAGLYAAHSHRFVAVFAAVSATLLTLLAFLQLAPSASGLAWLGAGVVLLHAEFLWPTAGIAGLLGIAGSGWGSWLLLAGVEPWERAVGAALGTLVLLAAVARTMRLRTLPA